MNGRHFKAPWGNSLKIMSALMLVVCFGSTAICLHLGDDVSLIIASILPMVVILGCIPFVIRGYRITDSQLIIYRLLHSDTYELNLITEVMIPKDMNKKNWRTMGNGGAFSFSGNFKNEELGHYRAFVNDWNTVVAFKCHGEWIAVSPENRNSFKSELESKI